MYGKTNLKKRYYIIAMLATYGVASMVFNAHLPPEQSWPILLVCGYIFTRSFGHLFIVGEKYVENKMSRVVAHERAVGISSSIEAEHFTH